MIIFLYGTDSYRRTKKKIWYVKEFEKKHGVSGVRHFDLSFSEAREDFFTFLSHRSLFGSAKFAAAENVSFFDKKNIDEVLAFSAKDKESHILFSEENAPPKAIMSRLAPPNILVRYELLKGVEWKRFVSEEAREMGVHFDAHALDFLATAYEGDAWRLATELQKIRRFGEKTVTVETLKGLGIEFPPDTWKLIQGLKSANASARFLSLELLFAAQEPAAKIFNIVSSLWQEKASHFAAYDRAIKAGKIDYEEALLALVAR